MSTKTDTLDIGGEEPAAKEGGAGLVLLYAPDPSQVPGAIPLGAQALVVGRDPPPGGLKLPFGSISRVHARVGLKGAEIVVDDLESRNGTFHERRKIEHAFVKHGDVLRFGEVIFKVVARDVEAYGAMPLEGQVPARPLEALRGGVAMEHVRHGILRIAKAPLSVLVLGETGTGKELVARALHDASGRVGRLASVNCAAIPATLLESELFGYKRGAFTGADRDRVGLVASADGGTLFLDEIGDLPVEAQAKLLRMIETRSVMPLGSHHAEPVDVRIVCATHRPLAKLVREDRFRPDLFARISGHVIELPPLRARKEDLYQLALLFLERAGGAHLRVTPAFMIGLFEHGWPFNVRELEAAMKRAVALADDTLDQRHLPPATKAEAKVDTTRGAAPEEAELRAVLVRHAGNVAAVARELGKDRVQIHRWLKRYAIDLDDFRAP